MRSYNSKLLVMIKVQSEFFQIDKFLKNNLWSYFEHVFLKISAYTTTVFWVTANQYPDDGTQFVRSPDENQFYHRAGLLVP